MYYLNCKSKCSSAEILILCRSHIQASSTFLQCSEKKKPFVEVASSCVIKSVLERKSQIENCHSCARMYWFEQPAPDRMENLPQKRVK